MKKYLFIMFSFAIIPIFSNAQSNAVNSLVGYYKISNWTQVPGTGSIDITGAPDQLIFTSGNSEQSDFTYVHIKAFTGGVVSISWNYSTIDPGEIVDGGDLPSVVNPGLGDPLPGASYDFPFYVIDGIPHMFSSFNPLGPDNQSGVETFPVLQNQTFGFGAYSTDGLFGSCTINTFSFSLPSVPIALTTVLAAFGLVGITLIVRKKVLRVS